MVKKTELYLRNVIFGIADSLVSTVGLLAGIDVAGTSRSGILLTGIVYAFVEAFSMAVGSFLSEQSAEEYEAKGEVSDGGPIAASVVMFLSFVIASFIPIVPYLLFSLTTALWTSIGLSIIALGVVGIVSARIVKVNMASHAVKMMLLGGAAIVIGVLVGKFIKTG
jgi:VIT1/CCC1 family predicted Fe2+/Mn2+ transporter